MSARDDILRCTRDLYLEHGLAGLSLRAVGKCAGVTAAAIYRHFDGKEDLLWSVCLRGHEIFATYLARGLKGRDPRERLVLTGTGYMQFAIEQRPYYAIMFVAPPEHLGFHRLEERNRNEGTVTFQMLVDRVRECMDAGVLAAGDPHRTSLMIWAHVHGLVTLYHRVPAGGHPEAPPPFASEESFSELYHASLDHLLRGLAPR
jgi:AcrR family transcriptional regulator